MLPRKYLILLLISSLATHSFAQSVLPRFETLDVDDGLSQNSVYGILQDRQGFMWFGTADGLNRYDGERIKLFKMNYSPHTLVSNTIRGRPCEDAKHRIWYANETGIYYADPESEQVFCAFDFLAENKGPLIYYFGLKVDSAGNFWLADPSRGFVQYSMARQQLTLFPYPTDVPGESFAYATSFQDRLYATFTARYGTLEFNTVTKHYTWIPGKGLVRLGQAAANRIFRVENSQLSLLDTSYQTVLTIPLRSQSPITQVLEDPFGRVWVATMGDGLHAYFPDQNKQMTFRRDAAVLKSLPSDLISSLYIDATNNLWIGTDGGGVSRLPLKPPRFNLYPISPGMYPSFGGTFTRCFYEDARGRIWFGTINQGLAIFDPTDRSLLTYDKTFLGGSSVGAIFRDGEGNIWIGHEKGIGVFDEERNRFTAVSNWIVPDGSIKENPVYLFTQLKNDAVLVGTHYGAYQLVRDTHGAYMAKNWKQLTNNVTGIKETPNGDVWCASPVYGFYNVSPGAQTAYEGKRYFQGVDIRSLHQDEQAPYVLWLCTGSGLIRFDTRTQDYKMYSDEIPTGLVYGILEDDFHNFWLSTNMGLCFFDRTKGTFQRFTVNDGLQSNEFNTGAFFKGPSGTLYFGGIKGFNWFKTGAEKTPSPPPRAGVTSLFANDQPVRKDSTFLRKMHFELPYDNNDLLFEFAVFDYTKPAANKIQYQLDGWDKQWVTTHIKSARYNNLPPGQYTLNLRASAGGDLWGEVFSVSFTIHAPFWQTRTFYGLSILVGLGIIVGVTHLVAQRRANRRLMILEKKRAVLEERERISKDIHDGLGSGLSKISILSEMVRLSTPAEDDFTRRQLDKISESSHELIDNLGDLIWSHNPSNDTLLKLFAHMREHLGALFDGTGTKLTISLPEPSSDISVHSEWRRNLFLIAKEALHNIIKHAEATEAHLGISLNDKTLTMRIADNGKGFNYEQKLKSGYGLGNIRKRVDACKGALKIETTPGSGTSLLVTVALNT